MGDYRLEVGSWFKLRFNRANKTFQATKAIELFPVANQIATAPVPDVTELGSVERNAEEIKRFIISLEWHGERMTILPAVCE